VTIRPPDGRPRHFDQTVLVHQPNRELPGSLTVKPRKRKKGSRDAEITRVLRERPSKQPKLRAPRHLLGAVRCRLRRRPPRPSWHLEPCEGEGPALSPRFRPGAWAGR
jgi:hypothetical protein